MKANRLILAAAAVGLATTLSTAQETSGLPGGASSIRESFDDWTIVCQQAETAPECRMVQQQMRQDGGRVLSVQVEPEEDGQGGRALLVLPFGLDLQAGVTLQMKDQTLGQPKSFSTCLPQGCLAEAALDADAIAAMKSQKEIQLLTHASGSGEATTFTVSLQGFAAAFQRIQTLTARE